MRVLLTGATGFLGGAVARELLASGHAVRALARERSDTSGLEALASPEGDAAPLELARGDALDPEAVRAALDGCDAVVHTAGLAGFRAAPEALMAANARSVEVVLGAARESGVARAVLTSSTAVLGGTRDARIADETSAGNAEALGIPYFVSKLRGEQVALALAARGLPVVVVRPAYVLGPGDVHGSSAATVVALVRRRIPAYVEGGASFCDVRDVARGHVAALLRGRPGETYVLGGHNLRVSELVTRVAELSGVKAPPRIPLAAALAAAGLQELFARLGGGQAAMTRELVRAAALYTFVSSAKAERELGYGIRPFDEMVKDTLRWAIARGRLRAETPELRALGAG
ncbi:MULTISPECIES: NAD-dependent epimerase/dehydratase family protein [Anaeromyxobacter]|uniref:NAD-dependent epimerase/dehydratase family protein n=1 Tax=Anaeromyxobacter TaxID=161492 RepID=UPI001F5AA0EF|nr:MULTISPECIES: NAD-dependent epimerase/dehydratase family protein [unclassified Anaeromyxobacter]